MFSLVLIFQGMGGSITTTKAAEHLGISSAPVRQLVADGTLPVQKFGPVNMVKESNLVLIMSRRPIGRPSKARPAGAAGLKYGTIESQTATTRKLNKVVKQTADEEIAGKKKGPSAGGHVEVRPGKKRGKTMSEQENTELVQQVYENFKSGDIKALLNLLSDHIECYGSARLRAA